MQDLKTKNFIWKAQRIHYGFYDYSKVTYINAITKVEIICPIHGSFWQIPNSHTRVTGCPKCAHINSTPIVKTTELFIKDAKKVHENKYDYSKSCYTNVRELIEITCPIEGHGAFWQLPHVHLQGSGCTKCGLNNSKNHRRKTINQFIDDAHLLHHNKYGYSKVKYVNAITKVEIMCPIHGSFWQLPYVHLKGSGCPTCSSSKGELLISKILQNNKIKFKTQWNFNKHKDLKGKRG